MILRFSHKPLSATYAIGLMHKIHVIFDGL